MDTIENHDSIETEFKDSFFLKTPVSVEMSEENRGKVPALSSNDISEIRDKIGGLMRKMNKSYTSPRQELKNMKQPLITSNDLCDLKDKMDLLVGKMHKTDAKPPSLSNNDLCDLKDKMDLLMGKMHKPEVKPPPLSTNDLGDLKEKMEILMNKMTKSEQKAQIHQLENIKLKETVKELESKLESVKMFHEPMNVSCNSKCILF